jgi:hypothetical protein
VPDGSTHNGLPLTLKGLKTKEIEMEFAVVYGYEVLQIFLIKKWGTRF